MYYDELNTLLGTKKHRLEISRCDWNSLDKTLLFENCSANGNFNTQILNATIEYILTTKRTGEPRFHS